MVYPNSLVIKLPVESRVHFKEYLTRVAETPTQNELAEELDEISKEILGTIWIEILLLIEVGVFFR